MNLISFTNFNLFRGEKELIRDSNFIILEKEKIGLIGRNGSGKSTLLSLIYKIWQNQPIDNEIRFTGKVFVNSKIVFGFLPQEIKFDFQGKVKDYFQTVIKTNFNIENNWEYEKRRNKIFKKLNLSEEILNKDMSNISGGEATRIGLAGVFLSQANFWLLDEPTNNLDLEGIDLLIEEIGNFKGNILIVTHDRRVLDKLQKIIEIDEETKTIRSWGGNYSFYKIKKEEEYEARLRKYEAQKEKRKNLENTIKEIRKKAQIFENLSKNAFYRSKGSKLAKRALAIEARIQRELLELDEPSLSVKPKFFVGNISVKEGNLIDVKNLNFSINNKKILNNIDLKINFKDKVLIKGPNGSGKSTLIKLITKEIEPESGEIIINPNIKIGYLPQSPQIENPEIKVKEFLIKNYNLSEDNVKRILNEMKISETITFKLKELSLGEIRRIQLAAILFLAPNVLILDEPTNHLDVYTIEELTDALRYYLDQGGTIIFSSHDEYFINDIKPNKVINLL
ncbi:MAG: ABC transporter ATP-binding protein [Candidatus Parcubacteria bacterium]|nr:MAG: ABC transporter ATP-binding protein [Candidatus Parcubacteria bacterium]